MKIWLQCVSALGVDPMWTAYEEVLLKHVQEVARPGNTINVHGVEVMTTGIERSRYFESLNTSQVINGAIQAEKEGYDAVAVNCVMDPGFYELREVIDIPVAFALESSCHLACILAPKFALLGYNDIQLRWVVERVKHYGLGERLVCSAGFDASLEALAGGMKNPRPVLEGAREAASRAAEQGADILIPTCACLNTILVSNGIREIAGLPLIDTVGSVIKTAELLVELSGMGINRVNRGLFSRVSKEELSAVRRMYKVE